MKLINDLKWRYATKQFDKTKKIPDEEMKKLMEVVRLSPSSYGLQLYKVLIIEDSEIREKLKAASWNQNQITDSSALIVFCNYKDVNESHIDDFIRLKCETENQDFNKLKGYSDFMKSKVSGMTKPEKDNWTKRQTYIALGFLLTACAELKIDACPMEGFEKNKYDEILRLSEQNLSASVIASIGYRSQSDNLQFLPKVRKSIDELFETVETIRHKSVA
ncbi:MAG: NAD(P)H-dependent oxidoreductase [Bacteroidetes bacterium]|nr:NAD(P)H-dependent oxidoreductase [Bacteroidota bacterium]